LGKDSQENPEEDFLNLMKDAAASLPTKQMTFANAEYFGKHQQP